jgi:hypothetical protein
MASTYSNLGVEKISTGEQAGVWGTTTNRNFEILEQAIGGVSTIAITTSATAISIPQGTLDPARSSVLKLTGSVASTITVSPNDVQKVYFIHNDSSAIQTIKQGTGTTVAVNPKSFKVLYLAGTGAASDVVDLLVAPDGGFIWHPTDITSAETLVKGNGYFVNTAGGAVTLTLPASPNRGDTIKITDLGNAATNNITVARNGNKIQGLTEDLTVSTDDAAFALVYNNTSTDWRLTEV